MDLVGKTFIFEKHGDVGTLYWNTNREQFIGKEFKVLKLHNSLLQYAYVKEKNSNSNDYEREMYYPVEVITKQLSPNYTQDLYKEIFKLIREICK